MASDNLNANLELLNSINVFPVPDQDTGRNMGLSMSAALNSIDDSMTVIEICQHVSDALLNDGKGNSGTILSLFFQGFASAVSHSDDGIIDSRLLANAFAEGATKAFTGMSDPTDGTILTIAQKAGEEGLSFLTSDVSPASVMSRMTEEAYAVLPLTAQQNPVLVEHNVIDSGALGFCMIMDGFEAAFRDQSSITRDYSFVDGFSTEIQAQELTYNYCTEFVISKVKNETPAIIKTQLADIGDCIIPVDSGDELKVHVHTNKPDAVFFIASLCGPIKRTKVDNMLAQTRGSGKPVEIYLCTDDMFRDALLSMNKTNVFLDEGNLDELTQTAQELADAGNKLTLLTSAQVPADISTIFPVIRFFNSDDGLLEYIYTMT